MSAGSYSDIDDGFVSLAGACHTMQSNTMPANHEVRFRKGMVLHAHDDQQGQPMMDFGCDRPYMGRGSGKVLLALFFHVATTAWSTKFKRNQQYNRVKILGNSSSVHHGPRAEFACQLASIVKRRWDRSYSTAEQKVLL